MIVSGHNMGPNYTSEMSHSHCSSHHDISHENFETTQLRENEFEVQLKLIQIILWIRKIRVSNHSSVLSLFRKKNCVILLDKS